MSVANLAVCAGWLIVLVIHAGLASSRYRAGSLRLWRLFVDLRAWLASKVVDLEQQLQNEQVEAELKSQRLAGCSFGLFLCSSSTVTICCVSALGAAVENSAALPIHMELLCMLGVLIWSLASAVKLQEWHVDCICTLCVALLGCCQFVQYSSWEYAAFGTPTFGACLILGCAQRDIRKVMAGNLAVYGCRLYAMPHYDAEPKAVLPNIEVHAMARFLFLQEVWAAIFVTFLKHGFELICVSLVQNQLGKSEVKVELGCVRGVLEEFCDGVVYLDKNMCVRGDSTKMAELLMTNVAPGGSLTKEHFLSYVALDDRQVFTDFLDARCLEDARKELNVADSICLKLLDSMQVQVAVKAYHSLLHNSIAGQTHLLAIQQLGDREANTSRDDASQQVALDFEMPRDADFDSSSESSWGSRHSRRHRSDPTTTSLEIVIKIVRRQFRICGYSMRLQEQADDGRAEPENCLDLQSCLPPSQWMSFRMWTHNAVRHVSQNRPGEPPVTTATFDVPMLGKVSSENVTLSLPEGLPEGDSPLKFVLRLGNPKINKKHALRQNRELMRKAIKREALSTRLRSSNAASGSQDGATVGLEPMVAVDAGPALVPVTLATAATAAPVATVTGKPIVIDL
eukprot:TRINITY_DN17956_c0_g3_i1.p1 TRINITY_DN17956_c0_g3~~TRINITY_DN17956_c0_g3_i1.p1  ORF type:complete len:625 (+),score=66.04 TRINITY_DN17956_c0_g3_i1:437-2311(+)